MPQSAVGAFMHTPGPKEFFVRFRGTGTWQFLGTCVQAPEPEETPHFIEIFNDYGGRSVPFQLVWDGATCLIPFVSNRMDLNVCRNVRDQPGRFGTTTQVGRESLLDRGSLVIGVTDFELTIRNTYFGTAHQTAGMPAGRKYFSVVLAAYRESTVGTRVEEVAMVFKANSVWSSATGFSLYTEDETELELTTLTSN